MTEKHILEKVQDTNPECEIWWDSSPLVYQNWADSMIAGAPAEKKVKWSAQLQRLLNLNDVENSLVRGVTTNPPLSYNVVKNDPETWTEIIRQKIEENPGMTVEQIFWLTYKEVIRRGAEIVKPIWEKSNHKYGYLSGQIDPRFAFDFDTMLQMGLEIAEISENVMVKSPGTREGYQVIEELTARGIATNNTLAFSLPQFLRLMEAIGHGLRRAEEHNVDLYRWRSVITHMSDRFGNLGDLHKEAEARGIQLSEIEQRWAEIAVFKRAEGILKEQNHPSKMLMCSMRITPIYPDGSKDSWHLTKLTGGDFVYTCPPKYITQLMEVEEEMVAFNENGFADEPPRAVMDKLMKIPYFRKSYEPGGMQPDQFNHYTPLFETARQFSDATRNFVDFVARQFEKMGRQVVPMGTPLPGKKEVEVSA